MATNNNKFNNFKLLCLSTLLLFILFVGVITLIEYISNGTVIDGIKLSEDSMVIKLNEDTKNKFNDIKKDNPSLTDEVILRGMFIWPKIFQPCNHQQFEEINIQKNGIGEPKLSELIEPVENKVETQPVPEPEPVTEPVNITGVILAKSETKYCDNCENGPIFEYWLYVKKFDPELSSFSFSLDDPIWIKVRPDIYLAKAVDQTYDSTWSPTAITE